MSFRYYILRRLFLLPLALLPLHTLCQVLSDKAYKEISLIQKTMENNMSVEKKNGCYTFKTIFRHYYWDSSMQEQVIGHLPYRYMDLDYSDPHEGLDHGGPVNHVTYEISSDNIKILIYDRVQLVCEFGNNGSEKAPNDPFIEYLKCTSGKSEIINGAILLDDDTNMKAQVSYSCSHSKRHMQYDGGETRKKVGGRVRKGRKINYFAPWQFVHQQTVIYDFNKIAKSLGVSKKQLAYSLIEKGIKGIVTNKEGIYTDIRDRDLKYFKYCLWNIFGDNSDLNKSFQSTHPKVEAMNKEQILNRANTSFEKAKNLIKTGNRGQAIEMLDTVSFFYKEALAWCVSNEEKQDVLEKYLSSLRTQTFNAYRLLKTQGKYKDVFDRNYEYFNNYYKEEAKAYWIAVENGLGIVALDVKDFDDAILHLDNVVNEVEGSNDRNLAIKEMLLLCKAYIGANKVVEAGELVDIILQEQPQNKEAIEFKKILDPSK